MVGKVKPRLVAILSFAILAEEFFSFELVLHQLGGDKLTNDFGHTTSGQISCESKKGM